MNTGLVSTFFVIVLIGVSNSDAGEAVSWYDGEPISDTQFPNLVIRQQFEMIDEDGNGVITRGEVDANLDVVRGTHLYGAYGFDAADFDANGTLDKTEFSAFEISLPAE